MITPLRLYRRSVLLSDAGTQKLTVTNVRSNNLQRSDPQAFQVVVTRFSLDPDIINSYYPPDGHQDEGRILPHIVFNDKHYPWEIEAGVSDNMKRQVDGNRNLVPWVALLVFDPEELHIDTLAEMIALRIPSVKSVNDQNLNGSFTMQAQEYFNNVQTGSRISFEQALRCSPPKTLSDIKGSKESVQVIFPKKQLFADMFQEPESMKYLAHVRNVNTVGFPDAGVEQFSLYSIVVSSRTGRFDITNPRTQNCHLVSIGHVESTVGRVLSWLASHIVSDPDRIGIFSLYSWVYTALPPDPVNFIDTVRDLIRNHQMLQTNDKALNQLQQNSERDKIDPVEKEASKLLYDRLRVGNVPARWRTETGEESAAINRGPPVPLSVPAIPTADLPDCSNTSKEFQIFDKSIGLMDLSYSPAWQLRKTLAISDTAFSSALMRLRPTLTNTSANRTRKDMNSLASEGDLVNNISKSISNVGELANGQVGDPQRLNQPIIANPIVDVKSKEALSTYQGYLSTGATSLANAGSELYNEFNEAAPNNNDWVLVHNWLMDKLFLADIPPHQLFPDPSFVPSEALRYFYIDDFWMDCLIDGALSVANHLDRDDDMIRVQIKENFNLYLSSVVNGSGIRPQIPGCGFVLRSKLVKTMPDLRIIVKWKVPEPKNAAREAVCRYTRYDNTTIICLLDRMPEELDSITLQQPPHQQRFSLGSHLTKDDLSFRLRYLYTDTVQAQKAEAEKGHWPDNLQQPTEDEAHPENNQTRGWFNWSTRCMNLRKMTSEINAMLQDTATNSYVDTVPNSCELALELNDPSYFFKIVPPVQTSADPVVPRHRQLYVNRAANLAKSGPQQAPASKDAIKTSSDNKPAAVPPAPTTVRAAVAPGAVTAPAPVAPIKPPNFETRKIPLPQWVLVLRKQPAKPIKMQSHFDLSIYPDYKTYSNQPNLAGYDNKSYIPTKNIYFFDLVFSLRKKANIVGSEF